METQTKNPRAVHSLTATLALAFFSLCVLALLISGGLQLFSNLQTQQILIARNQQLIAQEAARSVSSFIQEKFSVLETAVWVTDLEALSRAEQKEIGSVLLGRQPAFRQLVLFNAQGQALAEASRLSLGEPRRLTNRLEAVLPDRNQPANRTISPVYIDPVTSEPLTIMAVPIIDVFGVFKGTLMAEVNLKFMWDLVDRLEVGEAGRAYVVDKHGNLIAFGDMARVLRGENTAHLPVVREFMRNLASIRPDREITHKGIMGTKVAGTYVPLETPDWAVVTEIPWAETYREVIHEALWSVGITLTIALLASLLGVYLARWLAAPLVNLTSIASRIAGGEMELSATPEGTKEIVSLARAFNHMTGRLGAILRKEEDRAHRLQRAIVERRDAEEALRESESRFRQMAENIREVFWLFDWREQKVIYISPAFEEIWGRSIQEVYNRYEAWTESVHPDDIHFAQESFNKIIETGGGEPREYRIVRPDGVVRWISDTGFAITDDKNQVLRITGIAEDITKRKENEQRIAEALEFNKKIISESPIGISIYDQSGKCIAANDAIAEIIGATTEQVLAQNFNNIQSWKFSGLLDKARSALRENRKHRLDLIVTSTFGSNVSLDCHLVPFSADGQPRLLLMVNDITDRIRAEEELARNRDHLEELVEERTRELEVVQQELIKRERLMVLGQLTATVSHELRNPLGVINASTFYLQKNLPGADDKILKHLTRIDEQVNICDIIVGDLLEYTRDRQLEKVSRELNPWLKKLLDDLFGSEETKVIYELFPDVPIISFDPEKMRRVVVNMISNALQAVSAKQKLAKTEDVHYEPRVSLSTLRKEDHIVIRVEDNGVGMDEETRKLAFEPLFTTRARGTGLGLAIVEKIVQQHEGTVSLESRLDEGTTVIVVLPISGGR